ncbi:MAG: hypothetical protein MUE61_11855 [Vicinamibacterales bacterium]|jgi:hypothetical protein|nr:hypothetical protein [Vicinamibacterales bacterium]
MTAYDASNNLLGTAVSSFASNYLTFPDPGSAPNELLALAFPGIASVTISGDLAGGSFTLDDFAYESTEQTAPAFRPGEPRVLFQSRPDRMGLSANADLTRFLAAAPAKDAPPRGFTVVVNWQAALSR